MKTFKLPDLGEGLPEAEIVTWHVKEGQAIKSDEPLLAVETAKAVVDVPSPYTGTVKKLYAKEGDVVPTGNPLVDFEVEGDSSDAAKEKTPKADKNTSKDSGTNTNKDSGTVVGSMEESDRVETEQAIVGRSRRGKKRRVKAMPAVRALAKKLNVDLTQVSPSGKGDLITVNDVETFNQSSGGASNNVANRPAPMQPSFTPAQVEGGTEKLRGPRRSMSQSMSASRDQVAPCTLFDDADIHAWGPEQDITARVIRALVAAWQIEPGLNAWFDSEAGTRTIHSHMDLAMAVDTPDGLIVPVLRNVGQLDGQQIRGELNKIKQQTRDRSVSPAAMQNPTITLSNFGMMAGRYATPVIVPPTVTILGTGGIRHDVVAVMGGIEVHRRIPLSLTFDHRCITGGEACRFLATMIADLAKAY